MVVQKGANQAVKLISVPVFAESFSLVLLDIESFESYELKFAWFNFIYNSSLNI